jgi:lysozyme
MQVSDNGTQFTAQFEGLATQGSDGMIYPYLDPVGLPTIGYGSRYDLNGNLVTMNTAPISKDAALSLLNNVLNQVGNTVTNMVKVPLTQNQFDALVDFTYNSGAGNFASSTLLKLLNTGDYAGASAQFIRWNRATDRATGQLIVLPGLTRRRSAETDLFNTPDAS